MLTKAQKQAIVDRYHNETGNNEVNVADFAKWVGKDKDNPAYSLIWGETEDEAAWERRLYLARKFIAGLRVTVKTVEIPTVSGKFRAREFPAYISPMASRDESGGYHRFDPASPAAMAELRNQAISALQAWLRRYGGAFSEYEIAGVYGLVVDEKKDEAA